MVLNKAVIRQLKIIWHEVVLQIITDDLERTKELLIKADSMDEVRKLQGIAAGLMAVLDLPEHLENRMLDEEKVEGTVSG